MIAAALDSDLASHRLTSGPLDSDLLRILSEVDDPEFGVSIVDMGLIVSAMRVGTDVQLELTFTAMGCPATEMIIDDIRDRLLSEADISSVSIDVVWNPIWTAARLSHDARLAFQSLGIAV